MSLDCLSASSTLKSVIYRLRTVFFDYADFLFVFKPKTSRWKIMKGKRNVLCITGTLLVGGAEKLNLNIAKGVDSQKYSFHLMTTEVASNIWVSKFKPHFLNIITPGDIGCFSQIDYKRLKFLIRKLNIEIVLLNQSGYEYVPYLKAQFRNIAIVDIVHNEVNPSLDKIERSAPYVDRRICISNRVKNCLMNEYSNSKIAKTYIDRLTVIHNGIDVWEFEAESQKKSNFKSRFSIHENTVVISFIGRFSEPKNPLLFVEIAKKLLSKSNKELKFVMAGNGLEFEKVSNLIKSYGLEDHFILLGMIDNVAELLLDTNILLIVSKREGLPLTVLEAMSMGVPVISNNVGAINEIIE